MSLRMLAAAALAVSMGCGLRSDPRFDAKALETGSEDEDGTSDDGPATDPCEDPIVLPAMNIPSLKGTLEGRNRQGAWCGADDGPEIVYELLAPYDTDIILQVLSSDVPLTLRVEEGGCGDESGMQICATDFNELPRSFWAQANTTYFITVDADAPEGGDFELALTYGYLAPEFCGVHDTTIIQEPGGSFQWFNEFGKAQGYVDSRCGAPGRENMFLVETSYPGNVYASVSASGGFEPVISLRTTCGVGNELVCDSDGPNGYAEASAFIDDPSLPFYVVVDQVGYDGGGFDLFVSFD